MTGLSHCIGGGGGGGGEFQLLRLSSVTASRTRLAFFRGGGTGKDDCVEMTSLSSCTGGGGGGGGFATVDFFFLEVLIFLGSGGSGDVVR